MKLNEVMNFKHAFAVVVDYYTDFIPFSNFDRLPHDIDFNEHFVLNFRDINNMINQYQPLDYDVENIIYADAPRWMNNFLYQKFKKSVDVVNRPKNTWIKRSKSIMDLVFDKTMKLVPKDYI